MFGRILFFIIVIGAAAAQADLQDAPNSPLAAVAPQESNPLADGRVDATDLLRDRIRLELARALPLTRVELTGQVRWTRGSLPSSISAVTIVNQTARGEAQFSVRSQEDVVSEGWVNYAAWVPARIALKRIQPGEKLTPELFAIQDVNVAVGQAHEYRGVIMDQLADISRLEARQTVLEGQFLVSTAVSKIPDVRRGDAIRIQLISGDITLTTAGIAEEPGYIDGAVRVMSGKTKRELTGRLAADKTVEVRL